MDKVILVSLIIVFDKTVKCKILLIILVANLLNCFRYLTDLRLSMFYECLRVLAIGLFLECFKKHFLVKYMLFIPLYT